MTELTTRLPQHFRWLPDKIAEGSDGKINYHVVDQVKNKSVFSECSAFGLFGKVWWSRFDNLWCIEIHKKGLYATSLNGETIEDLLNNLRKYSLSKPFYVS